MAEFHLKKNNGSQKPFPGCVGSLMSFFDLNLRGSTNKLLTEKPHGDGSDPSRNSLQLSSQPLQSVEHIEPTSDEPRNLLTNVGNAIPMKMLLAQEISKQLDSKPNSPNLVARLMGLDAIPVYELSSQNDRIRPPPECEKNKYEKFPRRPREKYAEEHPHIPIRVNASHLELNGKCSLHPLHSRSAVCEEEKECEVVNEVRLSSVKERSNRSLQKLNHDRNPDERKMGLVRQKFMEAKHLANDERLRQSKEFQDALEVLSSNRDVFLNFLQEPTSLFANRLDYLHHVQSIPPQTLPKRITVLKPCIADIENGSWKRQNGSGIVKTSELTIDRLHRNGETSNQPTKKQHLIESRRPNDNEPPWTSTFDRQNICHISPQGQPSSLSHPTRIVVLKPSPRKVHDIRMVVASPSSSPKTHNRNSHATTPARSADGNKDLQELREITVEMDGSTSNHSLRSSSAREEPILSSVSSNGYVGDESSQDEYVGGNLSDSEAMTPTSQFSWDFINNKGNSYSSSHARASYSQETSVSKEAKRRLSQRWALMSHGNKEIRLRRSSSTLGEMLSTPEPKEETNLVGDICEDVSITSSAEDGQGSACISSAKIADTSPGRDLLRSKSVPASRTFDTVEMKDEIRKSEQMNSIVKEEKPNRTKSFKGALSNLFFSKNQKTIKCDPAPLLRKAEAEKSLNVDVERSDSKQHVATKCGRSASPLPNSREQCMPRSSPVVNGLKGGCSMQKILNQTTPKTQECFLNQEQLSPNSVLEPPFEDDSSSPPSTESNISGDQGTSPMFSPDPVSATLSRDELKLEDGEMPDRGTGEEPGVASVVYLDRFLFVQKLIAASGLDGESLLTSALSCQCYYSSNGPLHLSLLEKLNQQDKISCSTNSKGAAAACRETKLQQLRLERWHLFNRVNAALLDIGNLAFGVNPWSRTIGGTAKFTVPSGNALVEDVWSRIQKHFEGAEVEAVLTSRAAEGMHCVDKLLRKELGTSGSSDWKNLQLVEELDAMGREIQSGVLSDLIEDVVLDVLCSRC